MKLLKRSFCIFLLVGLLLSSTAFAEVKNLTILHTNDHHGHFMKFAPYPVRDVGGLAAQSTLVNITRAEVEKDGGVVLLLSAGDFNTGIPESDMLDAEPDIKIMNAMGFDALALGNHEFDNARDVLLKQQEWAEFPFLAANIVKKGSGEPLVESYVIKEYDGLKVAIFGLTTTRTPVLTLPENTADLEFKDPVETAKALVPKLKEEADIVVALTHMGFYEESSHHYELGDVNLAAQVPEIDVVVGGHSHTKLTEAKVVGDTLVVQAGSYSEYVGRLDLVVDTEANKVTESAYKLISVNGKKRVRYNDNRYYMYVDKGYVEDGGILEMTTPYAEQADELLSQPIGETLVELLGTNGESRSQETNLGNLITDAMAAKAGADIALQNGGGIRTGIAPGTITYRDVLMVQPFGNTLVVIDMTGQQIVDMLNFAATVYGGGGFPQVSGIKWTLNKTAGAAENVMIGDAAIDLNKTYKVATNNFMAAGGDGYAVLKDLPKYDTGFVDADVIREYITNAGTIEPKVEGRLTIVE